MTSVLPPPSDHKARVFVATGRGDRLYFAADNLTGAKEKFRHYYGDVPAALITWQEADEVPAGIEPF